MTMRQKANYSFIALLIGFAAAAFLLYLYPEQWWTKLLLFMMEAGLVGALADWFAVSALFRHPLGIRWLPHTAIVPKNREKLIQGVSTLVETQLLSPGTIEQQLKGVKLVDKLITWIDHSSRKDQLPRIIWEAIIQIAKPEHAVSLAQSADSKLKQYLSKLHPSQALSKGIELLLQHQLFDHFIAQLLGTLETRLRQDDILPKIRELLEEEKNKMLGEKGGWFKKVMFQLAEVADAVNLDDAAKVIYQDILRLVQEVHDPEHELRIFMRKQLSLLSQQLKEDEDIEKTLQHWRNEWLDHLNLVPVFSDMFQSIISALTAEESNALKRSLSTWIGRLIGSYWIWFKQDDLSKMKLESFLQQFISFALHREHALIGSIVKDALSQLSNDDLVQFIESKVETDLQRIRVNGALIGATIGAIMYGFLNGVYAPLISLLFK